MSDEQLDHLKRKWLAYVALSRDEEAEVLAELEQARERIKELEGMIDPANVKRMGDLCFADGLDRAAAVVRRYSDGNPKMVEAIAQSILALEET